MSIEIQDIKKLWPLSWSDSIILSHRQPVENAYWVRFYSLPKGKRYPDTKQELSEIIRRHNALLKDLSSEDELWLVLSDWDDKKTPAMSDNMKKVLPEKINSTLTPWKTIKDTFAYRHMFACAITLGSNELDDVLRLVAYDTISGVIIVPKNLDWLYFPYDGGVDVVFKNSGYYNILKNKFSDWLSDRPDGL